MPFVYVSICQQLGWRIYEQAKEGRTASIVLLPVIVKLLLKYTVRIPFLVWLYGILYEYYSQAGRVTCTEEKITYVHRL